MLQTVVETLYNAASGGRMMETIRSLGRYHRVQFSDGYRKAAEECRQILRGEDIQSELLSYDAHNERWYLTSKVFQEWDCRRAWCSLVFPERRILADYGADCLSLIQRSYACDYSENPVEVVLLDRGPDSADYPPEQYDLRGKAIFVRDDFYPYLDWAVEERGAIGILCDDVVGSNIGAAREKMTDVRHYKTFWWTRRQSSSTPFGFMLTPRGGEELAALCRRMRREHEHNPSLPCYPRITCQIDADFHDGTFENVSALLPGESSEEILLLAHLCHPRFSANDNASGVAAVIEAVRMLRGSVAAGTLPPLKRSIRLLLLPEFTGLYAYLDSLGAERANIKAAINLDAVGGRPEWGYGPLCVSDLPRSTPSFVSGLAALLLERIGRMDEEKGGRRADAPRQPFRADGDHFILCDPPIGIPAPMLFQKRDVFMHTSGDTPEVISPRMMRISAALAASYAYLLSNLEPEMLPAVFEKNFVSMHEELRGVFERVDAGSLSAQSAAYAGRHIAAACGGACADALRFFGGEKALRAEQIVKAEQARIAAAAEKALQHGFALRGQKTPRTPRFADAGQVLRRKYQAPVLNLEDYALGSERLAGQLSYYDQHWRPRHHNSFDSEVLAQYYINGQRTEEEVLRLVICDAGGNPEAVRQYLRLLAEFSIVEYVDP